MSAELVLPAITALLTLANTVVLYYVGRRAEKTHELVDGLRMAHIHEAEERGRRLERHEHQHGRIGE